MSEFLSRLPTLPDEMPFVQARPRKYKSHAPPKALFKVDVQKLRLAFDWLKRHNPYYQEVEWNENNEAISVVREANNEDGEALPVSNDCFQSWMEHAEREDLAGDVGYPIGRRVLELLTSDLEEDDSADLWILMRREVADAFDKNVFRKATTLPQDILSLALCTLEQQSKSCCIAC